MTANMCMTVADPVELRRGVHRSINLGETWSTMYGWAFPPLPGYFKFKKNPIQRYDLDKIDVLKEGYEVVNQKNNISKNNFIRVSDPDIDYEKLMKQKGHKFKCTTCKKSFNDRSNCRKHIRLHTNTKIYHCKVCKNYSSPSSTNMNKHLNIHSVSKTMSYRCKTCKIQFAALSTVKKHVLIVKTRIAI